MSCGLETSHSTLISSLSERPTAPCWTPPARRKLLRCLMPLRRHTSPLAAPFCQAVALSSHIGLQTFQQLLACGTQTEAKTAEPCATQTEAHFQLIQHVFRPFPCSNVASGGAPEQCDTDRGPRSQVRRCFPGASGRPERLRGPNGGCGGAPGGGGDADAGGPAGGGGHTDLERLFQRAGKPIYKLYCLYISLSIGYIAYI